MDASVFLTTSWSLGCFSLGSLSLGSFSLGSFSWSFSWTCQDNGLEFRFQGPRSVLGARPKWALRHGSGLRTIAGKGMQNRVESTRIQNAKCCMSWAGSFWKVFLGGQTRLESKATVSRRERKRALVTVFVQTWLDSDRLHQSFRKSHHAMPAHKLKTCSHYYGMPVQTIHLI